MQKAYILYYLCMHIIHFSEGMTVAMWQNLAYHVAAKGVESWIGLPHCTALQWRKHFICCNQIHRHSHQHQGGRSNLWQHYVTATYASGCTVIQIQLIWHAEWPVHIESSICRSERVAGMQKSVTFKGNVLWALCGHTVQNSVVCVLILSLTSRQKHKCLAIWIKHAFH